MKTLFTLLLTVGSLTSVFAQNRNDNKNDRYGRDDNNAAYDSKSNNGGYSRPNAGTDVYDRNNDKRDYAYNDRHFNESFSMTAREREFQIQKIIREYDFKISSVSRNRYLRPWGKSSQIRNLERQRNNEIRYIQARFYDKRNRHNDGHSHKW
ncbi:MAG: hypothetical protein ABIN89_24570 [Chitinophagaceae bacterium]